ncbi:MAG: TSUP family transporter, partial [Rhodospirillaceae bacterium]|nr:TSUP family transporter [Rhodospirillaceae bacterium]
MTFGEFDSVTLSVIAVAFLLGGFSKGGVGFGLPLIAMPIMANVISIPLAIGLLSVPIVASNTWQAFSSGLHGAMFRRFWTLILALVVATAAGAQILT